MLFSFFYQRGWRGDVNERLLTLWEDLTYFAIRNESNR